MPPATRLSSLSGATSLSRARRPIHIFNAPASRRQPLRWTPYERVPKNGTAPRSRSKRGAAPQRGAIAKYSCRYLARTPCATSASIVSSIRAVSSARPPLATIRTVALATSNTLGKRRSCSALSRRTSPTRTPSCSSGRKFAGSQVLHARIWRSRFIAFIAPSQLTWHTTRRDRRRDKRGASPRQPRRSYFRHDFSWDGHIRRPISAADARKSWIVRTEDCHAHSARLLVPCRVGGARRLHLGRAIGSVDSARDRKRHLGRATYRPDRRADRPGADAARRDGAARQHGRADGDAAAQQRVLERVPGSARFEFAVPVEEVAPRMMQEVGREGAAVLAQRLRRRLHRAVARIESAFGRNAVAFAQVAARASGDDVFPCRMPAARARHDMVEGQVVRWEAVAAILADEA